MAWFNPSTWTVVDNLQGQNSGNTEPYNGSMSQPVQEGAYDGALYYNGSGLEQYQNGAWNPYSISGGTSGGGGGADYSGNYAQLDSSEQRLRDLLGRTDTTLGQGLQQLGTSYTQQQNEANQKRTRVLEDYGNQRVDTTNAKQGALGKVDTEARTLNDKLRRILGLASGSGSSAFQFAAPNAVARQASQQRQGVQGDFATNFRNLDVAENRAKVDFEDLIADLLNQRNQREYELRSGIEGQKQGIFGQLGDIASQRAALQGGGYAAQVAAARPYQDQYNQSQSAIEALFGRFQPQVQAKAVNPQQVDLKQYQVDRAAVNTNNQQGTDAYSPYAQFLKRQRQQTV